MKQTEYLHPFGLEDLPQRATMRRPPIPCDDPRSWLFGCVHATTAIGTWRSIPVGSSSRVGPPSGSRTRSRTARRCGTGRSTANRCGTGRSTPRSRVGGRRTARRGRTGCRTSRRRSTGGRAPLGSRRRFSRTRRRIARRFGSFWSVGGPTAFGGHRRRFRALGNGNSARISCCR